MGKNSVNRTKFQPSSSSKAMGLMQNTGFIGFSSTNVSAISELSGNLQQAFKKASKKDATTKLKAFTQLQELFSSKEVDENLESCLGLWCNLFRSLLLERERRIREIGIRTHGVLMKVAGRRVAPFLKRLIGPWILFLHDSNRSCRNVAMEAFSQSIPEQKHIATWIFCKEELMNFLSDRIDQTQQSLCPPSVAKGVEAGEIYEENMTTSLLSLNFLLRTLPAEETEKIHESLNEIFQKERFWKLANIQGSNVLSGFLQLLDGALIHIPTIVKQHHAKIFTVLVQSLKSKDQVVSQVLWAPLVRSYRDYSAEFSSINAKSSRQMKEQIFSFFRDGAHGAGSIAYASLPVLVRFLPESVTGENKEKYFEQILASIWKGTACTRFITKQSVIELITCYIDIFIFALNDYFLSSFPATEELSWMSSMKKPFKEFLQGVCPSNDQANRQFVRIFSSINNEYEEKIPALFQNFVEIIEEVFNDALQSDPNSSNDQVEVLQRVAKFLSCCYTTIPTLITSGQPNVIQKLFGQAMKSSNQVASLMFISSLTKIIPFDACVTLAEQENYFNAILLPLAKETISKNGGESLHSKYILEILGNYFHGQAEKAQILLWKSLLLMFQELKEIQGLYSFLRKNISPESKITIWRTQILDDFVLQSISSTEINNSEIFFNFLRFTLGGSTMTPEASIVSENTRIVAIEELVKQLHQYREEPVSEGQFNMKRIQWIVFALKLSCDALATNLVPGTGELAKKVRLEALQVFFELSVDIKYFWKKMKLDTSSFVVSASISQFDHFELSSNGFSMEQIEQSPVALAARYAWKITHSSLQVNFSKQERINFITSLVHSIHGEMKSCDITWFRPNLHTTQVRMLLAVIEHSATQFLLDMVIQPEETWNEVRQTIGPLEKLVDFFKCDISFFNILSNETKSENISTKKSPYPRMLCFLLSLMNELGIDVVVGKSDFRRIWTICETYCGYVLCKDIILPPVDKSSEWEEEWAMVVDSLLPVVNKQFSFPPALASPFNKALVNCLFSRNSVNHISLLQSYANSFLIRKFINGDHLRAEEFISLYLPSITTDVLTENQSDLIFYQSLLGEIFGSLKPTQYETLGITKVYQAMISHLMDQRITSMSLEILIHLSNPDGIICDTTQVDLASSLLVFFSEWEAQSHPNLSDPTIRSQILRLLFSYCNHPKMVEQLRDYSDFITSFIINTPSIQKNIQWDDPTCCGVLYNALKLAKVVIKLFNNENNPLENLISWLVHVLVASCNVTKYSPSHHNLLHTLNQSIQNIPSSYTIGLSPEQESSCYKLLRNGHYGLQLAAFHILRCSIRSSPPSIQSESSELREMISGELYELLHKSNSAETKHFVFLDEDWLSNDNLESEEIGYYYRSGLIGLVSYSLAWILLCELYSRQSLDTRRNLSSGLREEASIILGFIFRYVELRSPTCIPSEMNLRAFDPRFVDYLDKFICDLYLLVLRVFPSLVREWWCTECNRAMTNYVEAYTTKFISPALIRHELRIIQEFNHDYDNFEVKGNLQLKQVQAFYEEDEVQLGINLSIPESYPLRDIVVTSEKKIGVTENQWRQWMLSIHVLLHTQDANLLDAVLLWKTRMDKLFEGIECCLICYSVFQVSNNSLPRLACKTCKNKFHSACLYKWFNTSHKSNCPLCQTPWME